MTATLDGTEEEVIVRGGRVTVQLPRNGAVHTFQLTIQDGAMRQEPFRNGVVSCSAHSGCRAHLAAEDDSFSMRYQNPYPGGGRAPIRSRGCSSTSPIGIERNALADHCRVRLRILMMDRK